MRTIWIGAGVGLLLGCAGLSPSPLPKIELLTLRSEGKGCLVELVSLPAAHTRLLAQIPGHCHDWELVLSRDGARLLLPSAKYEVDLAAHEAHELPPLKDLNQRNTVEQALDYDAQGAPTWKVRVGLGERQWVDGVGEVYPDVDERRYVLKDGSWVEQDAVSTSGLRLHPTLVDLDATEVTDPVLRGALEQASGSKSGTWWIHEPVACAARDEGEAGLVQSEPVLVKLGGEWKELPTLGSYSVALEVRGPWLRMADYPDKGQVVDLTTGDVVWSGAGAVLWPEDLPLPPH